MLQEPQIFKNLLSTTEHQDLIRHLQPFASQYDYDPEFNRFSIDSDHSPILKSYAEKLLPVARDFFKSETLLHTYSLFVQYQGPNAQLPPHKDKNACTYTLDYCLYQTVPWKLWVENKSYQLEPNDALAYYGENQLHWRENFSGSERDHVAMVFFHFAEPDHWFFNSKG